MSWRRFFRRAHWDEERARELMAHLEIEIDDNLARGLSPDDARAAAYRKLGNPTLVREEIYGMNSITWLDAAWKDLKYAARVLRKTPSFSIVAILSLALGIGANTAIFQLINAVRLRALPLPHADRLVELRVDTHGKGRTGNFNGQRPAMTYPLYEQLRTIEPQIGRLFAWGTANPDLANGGESRPARSLVVSGSLFSVAGVKPALGRLIAEADDQRGCGTPPAVLSYAYWQSQFGGDSAIVGRALSLNGSTFIVSGVTEPSFFGFEVGRAFDIAVPICAEPILRPRSALDKRDVWWLSIMARMNDGDTITALTTRTTERSPAIFQATLPPQYRETDAASYKAFTLQPELVTTGISQLRTSYAQPLTLLLVIAGLVLLIACGNLANLMLARASVRQSEMAVRLAIGASRRRLIRQLMVESLLLAGCGAVAGTVVAGVLSRSLVAFLTAPVGPRVFVDLGFDWAVLGFTTVLSAVTCVLFGLAPAFRATRTHPAQVMRSSGRGLTDGHERVGLRRGLVVGQLAVSLVLVIGALLFGGTLKNLIDVDPGFRANGVMELDVDYRRAAVPPAEQLQFQLDLVKKVQALPGVVDAASAAIVPLTGAGWNQTIVVDGKEQKKFPNITRVSPSFFRVMTMPIIAGRNFEETDGLNAPSVAIVTESFGREFFGTPASLGRRFRFAPEPGRPNPEFTVIGVVRDIKYHSLDEVINPVLFLPHTQEGDPGVDLSIVYRANGDVAASITKLISDVHPRILVSFTKVDEVIRASLVRERLMATLSGFFGAVAMLLAAVGLYGVMSYVIERRRAEIGIRMALGAAERQVLGMFMRESAWLIGIGLAAGVTLAHFAAKSAATLLFGLKPTDPLPFVAATLLLAAVAALAAFVPARRAARQSPTVALRG